MLQFYRWQATISITIKAVCHIALVITIPQIFASPLSAQTDSNKLTSLDESSNSRILIEPETSRSKVPVGSDMIISGKITNLSKDKSISLRQEDLKIALPVEVDPETRIIRASFPTQSDVSSCIEIKPGESYRAIWLISKDAENVSFLSSWYNNSIQYTFFQPGSYSAIVNAKYWVGVSCEKIQPNKNYNLYTKAVSTQVDVPQEIIIFGAVIGGFLSWLLIASSKYQEDNVKVVQQADKVLEEETALLIDPNKDDQQSSNKTPGKFNEIRLSNHSERVVYSYVVITAAIFRKRLAELGSTFFSAVGAMLLSGIVTILLSRISDTKFLINLTVNDFWGAIATGFVAHYFGSTWILDKFKLGSDQKRVISGTENGVSNQPEAPVEPVITEKVDKSTDSTDLSTPKDLNTPMLLGGSKDLEKDGDEKA